MDIQEQLNRELGSLACIQIENYAPDSWNFDFDGKAGLNVGCPWRIVNNEGIVISGTDHGHKFGLEEPADVSQVAGNVLSNRPVQTVVITGKTSDLVIYFTDKIELQLFNNSSGFEGWNIGTKSGLSVIGMGGGKTAILSNNSSQKPSS
jgi:hypothetical protein